MGNESWCKVASNLDSHPKIRRAGRNGREVYLFALRKNAEPGNPVPGLLAGTWLEPWYIADQLMMSERDAEEGLSRCVTAGLLVQDEGAWVICGWDNEWAKRPLTDAERKAAQRARDRDLQSRTQSNHDVTAQSHDESRQSHECPNDNVTGHACHGSEEMRGEEIRGEEKRSKTPIVPTGDVKRSSNSRRRKPKPSEPTESERVVAMRVLEKLSERNGVRYSGTDKHIRLITRQLRADVDEYELRAIVALCASKWTGKPEYEQYLRPETLFGPETISKYLDPARTEFADEIAKARAKAVTPKLTVVDGGSA